MIDERCCYKVSDTRSGLRAKAKGRMDVAVQGSEHENGAEQLSMLSANGYSPVYDQEF